MQERNHKCPRSQDQFRFHITESQTWGAFYHDGYPNSIFSLWKFVNSSQIVGNSQLLRGNYSSISSGPSCQVCQQGGLHNCRVNPLPSYNPVEERRYMQATLKGYNDGKALDNLNILASDHQRQILENPGSFQSAELRIRGYHPFPWRYSFTSFCSFILIFFKYVFKNLPVYSSKVIS